MAVSLTNSFNMSTIPSAQTGGSFGSGGGGGGGIGMFGALMIAQSVGEIYGNIVEGYVRKAWARVAKAEYELNATIAEGQADMINFAKGISNQQWFKKKSRVLARSMARMGASGLQLGGSSQAVIVETQRQMNIDHMIDQFNYDQEIRYTKAKAIGMNLKGSEAMALGRTEVSRGYQSAFASALKGASSYALYKKGMGGDRTPEGERRSSIFDSVR